MPCRNAGETAELRAQARDGAAGPERASRPGPDHAEAQTARQQEDRQGRDHVADQDGVEGDIEREGAGTEHGSASTAFSGKVCSTFPVRKRDKSKTYRAFSDFKESEKALVQAGTCGHCECRALARASSHAARPPRATARPACKRPGRTSQ